MTINIFGACVSRDIFPEDTDYIIQQYVSFSSPLLLFEECKFHIDLSDIEIFNGTNFSKRNFLLDNNKNGLDYLFEKKSDFLILDIADIRMNLCKYKGQYITFSNFVRQNQDVFKKKFDDFEIYKLFENNDLKMFSIEKFYYCVEKLCDRILENYSVEQIILHEYYCAEKYIDNLGNIFEFSTSIADYNSLYISEL